MSQHPEKFTRTLSLGEPVMTYEEIAKEMGMTRSGVRKIEQRALRKAVAILKSYGYAAEDFFEDQA